MPNFTAGTTFGANDTVTNTKLNALIADAVINPECAVSVNSGTISTLSCTRGTIPTLTSTTGTIATLNSTTGTIATLNSTTGTIAGLNSTNGTVATLNSTTGTITGLNSTNGTVATLNSTTGTITGFRSTTGTVATLNSTTGTITGLNSTNGTVATLNSTTGTITGLNSTNGTVATLNSTTGTITNLNSTTGTVATFNSTTGTIPTLTSITKITSGTGTAAAPAISPTGDTNTGIFFPAADTVAFAEGGTESMRFDSSGNVGIGTGGTAAVAKLDVYGGGNFQGLEIGKSGLTGNRNAGIDLIGDDTYTDYGFRIIRLNTGANASALLTNRGTGTLVLRTEEAGDIQLQTANTERLRIASAGQFGIGGANYGTTGQVLTSAGASAAPSWQTAAAITSATAVASTSGTAIDFTGIPSTAKRITVMFNGVSTNGNSLIIVRVGTSGGFVTTGYLGSSFGSGGAANVTSGLLISYENTSAIVYHGCGTLLNITSNSWVWGSSMGRSDGGNAYVSGGAIPAGGVLTQIRITTVNGTDTFDAGSVNIIYEG